MIDKPKKEKEIVLRLLISVYLCNYCCSLDTWKILYFGYSFVW